MLPDAEARGCGAKREALVREGGMAPDQRFRIPTLIDSFRPQDVFILVIGAFRCRVKPPDASPVENLECFE